MNVTPEQIMSVVVSMMLLVIGIFAVSVIVTSQQSTGAGPYYDRTFTVSDPTVNQSFGTEPGMTEVTVYRWNGTAWLGITTTWWTYTSRNGNVAVDYRGL